MKTMLLACLLLAGCTSTPPRVVTVPAVCPAPREVPTAALGAVDALPDKLPALPEYMTPEDAAAVLFRTGAQSSGLYQRALEAARGLAEWIRTEGAKQ